MKVFIYWNFHKKLFSVRYKGRVIAHVKRFLVKDAELKVSEAGRQRVLREKCKNVHAGVYGHIVAALQVESRYKEAVNIPPWDDSAESESYVVREDGGRVSYNPYENDSFTLDGFEPVHTAKTVYGSINYLNDKAHLKVLGWG